MGACAFNIKKAIMKKAIFFTGIVCLVLAHFSCNTSGPAARSITGSWKMDSVTHSRDTEKARMMELLLVMAAGDSSMVYTFTKDSLQVWTGRDRLESVAYERKSSDLVLKKSPKDTLTLGWPADSLLTLTDKDSLQLYLSRIR
jgi:hypothetical protein